MTLAGFRIFPPSTVILADQRDPDVSWARHERTAGPGRGGVDVVAAVGTPVYAWADGTVKYVSNDGSAGNVARLYLTHDPGWVLDYKHLSRFASPLNGVVKRGSLIGWSGDSGAPGQPHVHYNLVDPSGIRRNPWNYIDTGSAASREEDDMFTDDDRNKLASIHKAVYTGEGDGGGISVINRLNELQLRVRNLDAQLTGSDGFTPNLVGHVLDVKAAIADTDKTIDQILTQIKQS